MALAKDLNVTDTLTSLQRHCEIGNINILTLQMKKVESGEVQNWPTVIQPGHSNEMLKFPSLAQTLAECEALGNVARSSRAEPGPGARGTSDITVLLQLLLPSHP